jgi:hypothetical protein
MEPHYFWTNEQLGDGLLVIVEAIVHAQGDGSEWTGWRYESTGKTAEEAADRIAFGILRDIMDRFPQELAAAMARVLQRGNPSLTHGSRPEDDLWRLGQQKGRIVTTML